jgi:phosphatidylserine/phosphatidylglycerophosphate/cardiolipin synthase-like enzyme
MEPDSDYKKPAQLAKTHKDIDEIFQGNKTLKVNALDAKDFAKKIKHQLGNKVDEHIQSTIDHCFGMAMERFESDHDKEVLVGLRQLVREIEEDLYRPNATYTDAFFFPNMKNIARVASYIKEAKTSIRLAIFSFTNDDLAKEILAAHERGVNVRLVTDDEAMKGKGADAQRCADAGIPTRTDNAEQYHMHNKYMVVDDTFVLTGSFNWTFQAGKSNQENVVVVDDEHIVEAYCDNFDDLWAEFADNEVEQAEYQEHKQKRQDHRNTRKSKKETRRDKNHNKPWTGNTKDEFPSLD